MNETLTTIILSIVLLGLFGLPIYGIIKERRKRKEEFEELPDEKDEVVPDRIFEQKLGSDSIYLSAHEKEAFDSLSIKQRRHLMHKQKALFNKGELFIVNHHLGGKAMITRLEAIRTGFIDPTQE